MLNFEFCNSYRCCNLWFNLSFWFWVLLWNDRTSWVHLSKVFRPHGWSHKCLQLCVLHCSFMVHGSSLNELVITYFIVFQQLLFSARLLEINVSHVWIYLWIIRHLVGDVIILVCVMFPLPSLTCYYFSVTKRSIFLICIIFK